MNKIDSIIKQFREKFTEREIGCVGTCDHIFSNGEEIGIEHIESFLRSSLEAVEKEKDEREYNRGYVDGVREDREKFEKIDHSIDVRYEPDVIEAFNKFIEKWCGKNYPHLIDSDEQDGEYMRDKIRSLSNKTETENKILVCKECLQLEGHFTDCKFRETEKGEE